MANRRPPRQSILVVNYEYPPGCGGGGVFTSDLVDVLEARGHDVHLVTAGAESSTSTNGLRDLAAFPLRSAPAVERALQAHAIDVIHGHFSVPSSLLLPYFARRHDVPLVVNAMGADVYDPTRFQLLRPLLAVANRGIFRAADRVVVPSQDMAGRIPGRTHPRVIPYFVDPTAYEPATEAEWPADRPFRLLTVARLVERKNLRIALRAVRRLVDEWAVDVEYTVVGSGPERDQLERAVDCFGIDDRVRFAGYVPDRELAATYQAHDCFLLPSHHEAFGIVVLEALASGLPVVASTTGGHRDLVTGMVGRLAPPDEPAAFAAAIRSVERTHAQLAAHARERVEAHYTPTAVARQYEQLYAEVAPHATTTPPTHEADA